MRNALGIIRFVHMPMSHETAPFIVPDARMSGLVIITGKRMISFSILRRRTVNGDNAVLPANFMCTGLSTKSVKRKSDQIIGDTTARQVMNLLNLRKKLKSL
jgi:hypothetical protein